MNKDADEMKAPVNPLAADIEDAARDALPCVPRKCLADFKRDVAGMNVLIEGGWGKRGGISMHISTTGSGKSVLQTQSALCFARGVPCCGLRPTRPFKTWVIQSEDDEDRVARDRDDIAAHLAEIHPGEDWNAALHDVEFLDFTGITGAPFIELLNAELARAADAGNKPDAVIMNPFNAYFGGNLKEGADASAFFKGGEIRRTETEGVEAVVKRHGVWLWIFSHTGKPPTAKDLKDWLNDPFSAYKMCGASEIADAVRSIITFLKVPDTNGVFTFTAGKNGNGLRWTDADGNPCTRALWQWGEAERHYWRDVEKSMWAEIWSGTAKATPAKAAPPPVPPRDETPIAVSVFATRTAPITFTDAVDAVRGAINADRAKSETRVKQISRDDCRAFLWELDHKGAIKITEQGKAGRMCGLPEVVAAYLNPPLLNVPIDAPKASTPGTEDAEPPKRKRANKRKFMVPSAAGVRLAAAEEGAATA